MKKRGGAMATDKTTVMMRFLVETDAGERTVIDALDIETARERAAEWSREEARGSMRIWECTLLASVTE